MRRTVKGLAWLALAVSLNFPLASHADLVTWEFSGVVSWLQVNGSPTLFPFPVSTGDRFFIAYTFESDTPVGYAENDIWAAYSGAISSVTARVGSGFVTLDVDQYCALTPFSHCSDIQVFVNNPDYGTALAFSAGSAVQVPDGPDTFSASVDLRNPGGPSPGPGPFGPLTSTEMPTAPIDISDFPSRWAYFITRARTDPFEAFDSDVFGGVVDTVRLCPGHIRDGICQEDVDPLDMLEELGEAVVGVGPGTSLWDKISIAQAYLAVPDVQSTCEALKGFINEVRAQSGRKISTSDALKFTDETQAIVAAIGCE